ncbi:MAG TPA: hypothetical protein VMM13_19665 [Euzebya sp.]|nr:hypothetical protein [Euzebya sp.]
MSAAALGLAACTGSAVDDEAAEGGTEAEGVTEQEVELAEEAAGESSLPEIEWEMPTSWPLGLDTIYGGAVTFADRVSAMTGGRFTIIPRAAGELVPGLEVLNAVESGGAPVGHTASYYYTGRSPVMGLGTALPFGLNYRAQNAWLYEGGGLEQLREFYADTFGVIQFPAGNTGTQMGGWFNRELNSVSDLQGLSMRIPGLGGEVMSRLGVTVQVIAGGEIFQALDTGAVDAAEWVGPYDDLQLGFNDAAQFYYYPGWWEPAPTLEVQMTLEQWNQLPSIYQEIVETASHQANTSMMARYDQLNPASLEEIIASGTELRAFPDDIMTAARDASFELFDEFAASDSRFGEIFSSWNTYRETINPWFGLAELTMLQFSAGGGS